MISARALVPLALGLSGAVVFFANAVAQGPFDSAQGQVSTSLGAGPSTALTGGLDPSALLEPSADSWPTYHGDYTGRRHSRLTQITPANVNQLTLAWAFQTGQTQQIKATPILVNGVIYLTTPDNVWAIDARSARQVWRYTYPANDGFMVSGSTTRGA